MASETRAGKSDKSNKVMSKAKKATAALKRGRKKARATAAKNARNPNFIPF